jgi:hypothetical protein
MIAIFNGTHFTMQFELYIQDPTTERIINSYAISPEIMLEELLKLIEDYRLDTIIFIGRIKIFKEIEKYYKMKNSEVQIIWQ